MNALSLGLGAAQSGIGLHWTLYIFERGQAGEIACRGTKPRYRRVITEHQVIAVSVGQGHRTPRGYNHVCRIKSTTPLAETSWIERICRHSIAGGYAGST